MSNYVTLLVLDKIYIQLDGNQYIFTYDDIFLDITDGLDELNIANNIDIYVILGIEINGLKKEVEKDISRRISNIFNGNYRLKKIFSLFEIINKKTYLILKDFTIKYDQKIEKLDFTIEDYEEGQDFVGYIVIKGYEELKDFVFKKELNKIKNFSLKIYIEYVVPIFFTLIIILVYMFFYQKYNSDEIDKKIADISQEIEEKSNVKEENIDKEFILKMKKSFKKPFYMDIEFFLNSRMFGVEYTNLEYLNDKWKIYGEIDNLKKLEQYEKSLEKYFGNYSIIEFKDKNEKISFAYELSNEKV
ncbi:hypothetical protein [Streptobacillus canis]|uniref:hypothetical protein n=1 Tax=Streptobacillus canis TaxID=2678686 RepID=UPI0012E0E64E|nr:hypothetical protein [Streptobacillus canis]